MTKFEIDPEAKLGEAEIQVSLNFEKIPLIALKNEIGSVINAARALLETLTAGSFLDLRKELDNLDLSHTLLKIRNA